MNASFIKNKYVLFFGALVLSFLLYANTIPGDFVYDDMQFNLRPELRKPSSLLSVWSEPYVPTDERIGVYRPLTMFSFVLEYVLLGESPVHFHIINIFLYGITIFLAYELVLLIFKRTDLALISAVLFAFLPVHTEAVANIKGRDEILATIFIILSWLHFIKATGHSGKKRYIYLFISASFCYIGILGKELYAPIIGAFIVVYWLQGRTDIKTVLRVSVPYIIVLIATVGVRYAVLGDGAFGKTELSFVSNSLRFTEGWPLVWTPFKVLYTYLEKTFIPIHLSATYHFRHFMPVYRPLTDYGFWLGLAAIGSLAVLVINPRTRTSPLGISAVAFFFSYLMISKFIFAGSGDLLAERWIFFPSLWLCVIAGYLILAMRNKYRTITAIFMATVLTIYGALTIKRNMVWISNMDLFESMVKDAPLSGWGYSSVAPNYYILFGDAAITRMSVIDGLSIYPKDNRLLNTLALIYRERGDLAAAEETFKKALSIAPLYTIPPRFNLFRLYYDQYRYEEAIDMFLEFQKVSIGLKNPITLPIALMYLESLARAGRYQDVISTIIKTYPPENRHNRIKFIAAYSLYMLNDLQAARAYFNAIPGENEAEKIIFLKRFSRTKNSILSPAFENLAH